MYTRIRRRLEEYSCHVFEPSLGATAPTYKNLVARPQPSRAAERVLPCSRVLVSTHSHVKILSTPLTPLLQGGTITYTLYLCHFQQKKRHNFGQKLINLENFHTFCTFQYPVPRCGATWPGPSSPEGAKFHASFLNIGGPSACKARGLRLIGTCIPTAPPLRGRGAVRGVGPRALVCEGCTTCTSRAERPYARAE